MADADRLLGGYDPNAGHSAHAAARPKQIPVPSLLRALLSEHLDPGYAAAAAKRGGSATPPRGRDRALRWLWQALAALLIATVFAAAVAQARSVAPGVRTAQQLLVRSVRSTESDPLVAAVRIRQMLTHRSLVVLLTDLDDSTVADQLARAVRLLSPPHLLCSHSACR